MDTVHAIYENGIFRPVARLRCRTARRSSSNRGRYSMDNTRPVTPLQKLSKPCTRC